MSIEQKPVQFNKEIFKNDFKLALEKYASAIDNFEYRNYKDDKELAVIEEKRLNLEMDKRKKDLVFLAVNSLKLTDNKKEILTMISQVFFDLYESVESQYWSEKEYFKEIILELLK